MKRYLMLFGIVVCLLSIALCLLIALGVIRIDRLLWKVSEPEVYYVEVRENQVSSQLHWKAIVKRGTPVFYEILPDSSSGAESLLKEDSFTVNGIFDLSADNCAESTFPCDISFDSRYHFIKSLYFSDIWQISVLDFQPCKDVSSCRKDNF